MLMDILGILTGFVAIMLLFSLLVTALVQGAQAAFDLRFKNFKSVILHFLENLNTIEHDAAKKIMAQIERHASSELHSTALPINFSSNKIKVTSINQKQLIDTINDTPEMSIDQKEQLKQNVIKHFSIIEEVMSQRFKQWMHQISIVMAFVICFVFQLNCFSLLQQLNEDSLLRHQAINASKQLEDPLNIEQANLENLQDSLQALNFKITPNEWVTYYLSISVASLTNWLGIIFSSILISLGAPFWFNRLKDIASLRDKLSKAQS
ncbi:hypothetical protein NBRC116188_15180 [Oceaniserpentilla sp. 4NH20-0058]|uniref:hypothetical protein n=1 Tax=Oceaniserpentilla sp. 4NH20-0058 TaxID=3127660 RepID=UPI003102E98B